MKKFLAGVFVGAGLVVFGILYSGCNHRNRNRAAMYYITDVGSITTEIEISNTTEVVVENSNWSPPGHHPRHHNHDGHED